MSQEIKEDLGDCVEVVGDAYNGLHVRILKSVKDGDFVCFVKDICRRQIEFNENKQIGTQTSSIWIQLSPPNLHLVAELCENGFEIHRGRGKTIHLNRWIAHKKCLIPPYSLFYIGCGAVVIKDDCIFLVEQKSGQRKGCFNIPGGRADPKQTISQCAERQLRQQTNLTAKFKYIIQFRQSTPSLFDSTDVYFPCLMQLSQNSLSELKLCDREIESYRWVPLKDYYQFMLDNRSTDTQKRLAEYITRLWKEGYDFYNSMPNVTKFQKKQKPNGEFKYAYHELINKF